MKAPKPSSVLRDVALEAEMLTSACITRGETPPLMPGWDLEAWADEFLGLTRTDRRRPVRTRRGYYTERELLQRSRRERVHPVGRHVERFAYSEDGRLIVARDTAPRS